MKSSTQTITRCNRAFTLIELLIIIGVIAILAAVFFPIFAKDRKKTQGEISCACNERQIGLAIMQYSQDADETMPSCVGNGDAGWANQIYVFVKSNQIFRCPDWTNNVTFKYDKKGLKIPSCYQVNGGNMGYGFNGMRAMAWGIKDPQTTWANITSPATTIILTGQRGNRTDSMWWGPADISNAHLENHTELSNWLLADGHVKALSPQATGSPINMWNIANTTHGGDTATGPVDPTSALWKTLVSEQALNQ